MRSSVFYDHILNAALQSGKPLDQVLSTVAEAGIQAVELDLYNFSDTTDHCALLKSAGVETACVNAHYSMERGFDEHQAQAHIDAAISCGANKILVVPGYLSQEEGKALGNVIHDKDATFSFLDSCGNALRIAEGLARITDLATQRGVTVTIEDFDNTSSPLSGLNSMLWFLEKIPQLMCNFDTGNFVTHGDDLFDAWELLKDRVVHCHCKDRGNGPVAIGDGYLPCDQILRRMAQDGYTGYVAIEHYGAPDQLSYILRSAAYLSSLSI